MVMKETKNWETKCFTKSFAEALQLLRILTDPLDFSEPFKIEIAYDPKELRTAVTYHTPKGVWSRYFQKELDKEGRQKVKKTEKRKQLLEIIAIGISAVLGWELGNLLF